ncbi:MAG: hypothetical protein II556_01005 [Bacteroidales bacterium]|nr:hypothetical protein [Bacteroidales bacterium]
MKKNFTIFMALMTSLLISAAAFGQDATIPFDAHSSVWGGMFAPQSPEALAITRYGDHAPDLYHGGVSLSIPVFHWKDNLFDIPISLEYSTTGFRPGAACGPEGLDWALNAGGVITREVRGIPDESYTTYYSAADVLYSNPSERPDPLSDYIFWNPNYRHMPDPYGGFGIRGFANWYDSNASYADADNQKYIYSGQLAEEFVCGSLLNSNPNVLVENEPDVFHFSFPGHSGSFILQPGHTVRFLSCSTPAGELQVEFYFSPQTQGTGSYFVIKDGQGNRYTFSDIEETSSFDAWHGSDEGLFAVSCWRLSSITHPSGKTVTFTYTTKTETNLSPVIATDHQKFSDGTSPIYGHPVLEPWKWPDSYDESFIHNAVYSKHLTNIDFAGRGSADFSWNEQGKLSSITVYNANNRLLKSCSLDYYVPKISTGARHSTLAFLTSVSLSGEGCYQMDYYSADDSHSFPFASLSLDNDLWFTDAYGYYNSVSLKDLFDYSPSNLSQKASYIMSGRIPDLNKTRMGVLSSITYPAGGRSEFSYELNRWSHKNDSLQTRDLTDPVTAGLRVTRIDTFDEQGAQVQCKRYSYLESDGHSSGVLLQFPTIYYNYHFISNTSGVKLRVDREAVSTTSTIGFTKESHIEYLRVIEEVSKTLNSPVNGRTVHTFNSASSINDSAMETEYIQEFSDDQTEFTFVNDGTLLNEWQNHGTSFFAGRPSVTTQAAVSSSSDPVTVTSYSYDLYDDAGGASARGKMLHFGRLCERVYNTCSPYTASVSVYETAANGSSSTVTTTVSVDSRGRISSVSSPDSFGAALSTTYSYHSVLPGLITQKTVTRGGAAVSSVKYDYYCKNSSTSWYVPFAISAKLVNGNSFGNWRAERTFGNWDAWGNPCSVTDAAGRTTSWTWGYSGLHPIACSRSSSGATLQQSWTWIPMVGPSSVTDPSGRTTSYYYDSDGRLTDVYNAEGSPVVTYDYYFPGNGDSRTYSDRTYIATTTYCDGGSGTDIVYYDGLGRPLQTVQERASGSYNTDIIIPTLYDVFGRPSVEEYPYPRSSNSGVLRSSWSSEQRNYYEGAGHAGGDDYLFGVEHTYENRPEGRVLSTTLPGYESYCENGSTNSYVFNSSGQLSGYSSGTCSGVITTDGDGHVTTVWTDREGRTVREDRHPSSGTTLSTIYEYDNRGNLIEVTQPKGTYFSYSYDALGRRIMKTVPGAGAELYVYDSAGRVVLSQDAKLREQNRWIFSTWDAFDCLTKRELISTNLSQSSLQAYFPVSGSGSLPSSKYTLVATLEEYGYQRSNGASVNVPSCLAFASDASASNSDKGSSLNLKIYEKLLSLPSCGSSSSAYGLRPCVERAFYYDKLGRELQRVERNILGGITRASVVRDCQGNPVSSTESVTLSANSTTPTVKHTGYVYDSRGRLTGETVQMDGTAVSSTTLSYDALGRSSSVSGNGLQQTQSYNFHGWVSGIQAKAGTTNVFSETLRYAEALHAAPLYSGSISEIFWQHGSSTPSTYAFSYDGAARLTGCNRYEGSTLDNAWTERDICYDSNGNITAIKRYGSSASTPLDDLSMSYSGNTLSAVGNASFSYDSAGNVSSDPLRSLSFSYNILNLPCSISTSSDEANYSYLADGTKALVSGEMSEDGYAYLGSMVFSLSEGEWLFDSTPFTGGMIRKSGSSWVADRHATDHLGSVRAVVRNGQVLERNDFYPYGGRHANASLGMDAANRWRFSGKEIQTTAGVSLLDFGARLYDDRLCRWNALDPMADKYFSFSPYAYCAGEPVGVLDTDGQKLYFKKGTSDEFKKQFADAVKIMNEKGTSYNLAKLEKSEQVYYIKEAGYSGNQFNWETKTIEWDPYKVSDNDETGILRSPLTSLAHESSHANAYNDALESGSLESFFNTVYTYDSQYDNKEERRVITTDEQTAAIRHGEIVKGEKTRSDHKGNTYCELGVNFKIMTQQEILDFVQERNKWRRQ